MTFSKKNHSTPLHSTHSTELFKIFFSLLTLSTAFLQKASVPGKSITCKDYENVCINCGTIHDYQYVNEISFKDYNMNMLNALFYKKTIYMRKKYLYKKCLHIKEINDNIILFFDNSLENIRNLYNIRISIPK